MYKHLYDCFKHWYHGGTVFFYSDCHFADPEMKKLRKPYISDEEQVRRIRSKIGKNDTLIILGDVGDVEWIKKLRGYKILVCGNHDVGATNYTRVIGPWICYTSFDAAIKAKNNGEIDVISTNRFGYIGRKDNGLFDEVYEGALMISDKIILSHEPVDFPYALNIHGHVHDIHAKNDVTHFNVCAEHINYTPIAIKEIVEHGMLKPIVSIHRETIDNATERKKKRMKKS